jgi:thioredoxin 1
VDTNQPLAARYQVSSIPALMIFKDGQIARQHVGLVPEATLRAELQLLA